MAQDPRRTLKDCEKEKDFFIGIDSDGCAFDTMEIKHKECFCPVTIRYFGLQAVSKYARETWDFVNLYSTMRGTNRFLALLAVMELLGRRREVKRRNAKLPDMRGLAEWTRKETRLGNPTLGEYARQAKEPVLNRVYKWSLAVNRAIEEMVSGIPPFPNVRESLERMSQVADVMVISQTPAKALAREWREHGIDRHVRLIAGQEHGTKTEHLLLAAGGKYPPEKILMIGDAPGDLEAAKANNALFFPVNPGQEDESWERFYNEGLERFFKGTFAGTYEQGLIHEFHASLPEHPWWEN